jgi:hypothetical protein
VIQKMTSMVERGQTNLQMSMSFGEQLKKLKDSLVSDEESYVSEEEVVVVELPKKQIDLVDLCDNDSDEEIQAKLSDSDEEIQVKPSQRSKKAAVKPINLDTDDEEDGGSDYWEMESESDDEEDSYVDSDGSWSGADELLDSDDMEEVTGSEEEEDLYNTEDENRGTRSRSQPRLQKSKSNSDKQVDSHPSSPGISLRRSTRLSSTVSPPPSSSSSR